jgi:DNA-binding GntR family transcriptional regulator
MRAALAACCDATKPAEALAADREFHAALAAAAKNPHLSQAAQDVMAQITFDFLPESSPTARDAAIRQHTALVDAIAAGDGDAAATLARTHSGPRSVLKNTLLPCRTQRSAQRTCEYAAKDIVI